MDQNQLKDLLYRADAVRSGHFLRASGRHSNLYIQCAHLFENARSADGFVKITELTPSHRTRIKATICEECRVVLFQY